MQSGFVGTGYVSERKVSTFREETPRAAKRRPGSISLPMDTVAWFALESIDLLDFEGTRRNARPPGGSFF